MNTLLTNFLVVMFFYSALDKNFAYFLSFFFLYHYLLLNHKKQMDHIVNYNIIDIQKYWDRPEIGVP